MSDELERAILGSLILAPALMESSDLTAADFPAGQLRRTFEEISANWEEAKPAEIDPVLLASWLGSDDATSFVSSLLGGNLRLTPEVFRSWVRELRHRRVSSEFKRKVHEQDGLPGIDLGELRPLYHQLEELEAEEKGPRFKRLGDIEGREVSWLWHERIPLGMLTLLAGDPGLGKSFLVTWLASRLSTGAGFPGAPGPALVGSTVYLAAEDSPSFALRPRAERNGGDLTKIVVLEDSDFDIAADLEKIRAIIASNPDVKLVIIDPLNSYIGEADYFKDPSVRKKLQPLVQFAEQSNIAILAVMHLNKKTDQAGIYRIGGSIAFAGIARSILAVTQDPEDPDRRFLRPLKMNYCRKPDPLAFRIGEDLRLAFEDGPADVAADESLSAPTGREAAEGSFAVTWLSDFLDEGPLELKDILAAAKAVGISRSTLFRARAKLDLDTRSSGFGSHRSTLWGFPSGISPRRVL